MKKILIDNVLTIAIFLFIGLTRILSITLYNMNQEISKREDNTSQLEIDLINTQIKNTELSKQLEKNDDMMSQAQEDFNKIKIENMEMLNLTKQYEKQIEALQKNPKSLYERGDTRFAVIADLHVGGPQGSYRPAVQEIVDWDPDFVILAGDMVYGNGDDEKEWIMLWNETLEPIRNANIAIYPVIGNHDGSFPLNQNDDMPYWTKISWHFDIGKGWYSFIIDNVKIVVVENNFKHTWNCENDYDSAFVEEQRISTELALSNSPHWLFVASHKGAYWNTTYVDTMFDIDETDYSDTMFTIDDEDYVCNQKIFDEWLDKYSIDMFISSHIHMGDTYLQNGAIYSHVPPANYFHPIITPNQRGQFAMYDIYSSNTSYPEGSIKIMHINFQGEILHSAIFNKNPDFISENSE